MSPVLSPEGCWRRRPAEAVNGCQVPLGAPSCSSRRLQLSHLDRCGQRLSEDSETQSTGRLEEKTRSQGSIQLAVDLPSRSIPQTGHKAPKPRRGHPWGRRELQQEPGSDSRWEKGVFCGDGGSLEGPQHGKQQGRGASLSNARRGGLRAGCVPRSVLPRLSQSWELRRRAE